MCFFHAYSYEEVNLNEIIETFISYFNVNTKTNETEHELMKPLFNWLPLDVIKNSYQLSTQHIRTHESALMEQTYRSTFLALNVK